MDISIFRELGFTEREIKVYMALLEIGTSTAGPIAVKSRLPHTKVYETLGKLVDKGLVSYVVLSKTKHYEARDPRAINNIIDDRKKRFNEILGELESRRKNSKQKQVALVHEGFKAIKALYDQILNNLRKGDFYYAFALKEDYKDVTAPIFLQNFHRKLSERKITDRAIASTEIKEEIGEVYRDNKNIKIRFVKKPTPIGVVIVKDRIIQLTWGERPTAIEIQSSQVHRQYKEFFEDLWKDIR